jgi:hypothetical protein
MDIFFCDLDSNYKKLEVTTYDVRRDALSTSSTTAAIYHPPCRSWSRLRRFSNFKPGEHWLGVWSILRVRRYGGIVEHPNGSYLFKFMQCNSPGCGKDIYGGELVKLNQVHWGHVAKKSTLLYIVGEFDYDLLMPPLPDARPTKVIDKNKGIGHLNYCSKRERSYSPILFCLFLINLCNSLCHHSFIGTQNLHTPE